MRIVLATLEYPTEPYRAGGMCWAFGKIASGLKAQGHEITVVVPAEKAGLVFDASGVPVHRYEFKSHLPARLEAALSWRLPIGVVHYNHAWSLYEALDEVDRNGSIDLVLAVASPESFIAAGSRRWRYVCRVSAYRLFWVISNFFPVTNGYLFEDWMMARACAWADARYAPSAILANVFQRVGCGETRVIHTPMTKVTLATLTPEVRERIPGRYVLFYGSLQGTKGAHLLADAMPALLEAHPDLHVVFMGRDLSAPGFGSMRAYIERALAAFPDRTHVPGVLEQAEALQYVARAEWVVFPSVMDNLPNALLEAMYLGRPIVVTRNSGTDELVTDGRNGLVVDSNDMVALREGLRRALAMNREQRESMGECARETVTRECDPEKAARALEDLLGKVASAPIGWRASWLAMVLRLGWLRLLWLWRVIRMCRWGASRRALGRLQSLCLDYLPGVKFEFKP